MKLVGGTIGAGLGVLCAAGAVLALALPHAVITSAPPATTAETTATFAFEASEPTRLAGFVCSLDSATPAGCTSPATYTDLAAGEHAFQVRLVGAADATPATHRWTVAVREQTTGCPASGACPNPAQPKDPAPSSPGAATPPGPSRPVRSRPARRRDAGGCAFAGNRTGEVRDHRIVRATLCLINRRRTAAGLSKVHTNRRLMQAAAGHARDMVRRHYFAHASGDGRHVYERVKRAGYLRRAEYWSLGEILAWGSGARATPATIVAAWMNSPPHRTIILRRDFRDIGLDVVHGTPNVRLPDGGTFVGEFGRRG